MGFYLYKGLKKPLVFFGLKDKYIYYALASAVGGLIGAAVISSFLGILGTFLGLALGGGGIGIIYKIQDKKGLYNKTKNDLGSRGLCTNYSLGMGRWLVSK